MIMPSSVSEYFIFQTFQNIVSVNFESLPNLAEPFVTLFSSQCKNHPFVWRVCRLRKIEIYMMLRMVTRFKKRFRIHVEMLICNAQEAMRFAINSLLILRRTVSFPRAQQRIV